MSGKKLTSVVNFHFFYTYSEVLKKLFLQTAKQIKVNSAKNDIKQPITKILSDITYCALLLPKVLFDITSGPKATII